MDAWKSSPRQGRKAEKAFHLAVPSAAYPGKRRDYPACVKIRLRHPSDVVFRDYRNGRGNHFLRYLRTDSVGCAEKIQKPVILTIRTAAEGGEVEIDPKDYFNVYKLAVEANAFDIYDVELALGTNMAIELRTLIHDAGKYMLMSSHNFDRTPEVDSLMQKFRSMDSLEADIMKVAVMPEDYQDLLNLLSFTVQAKHEYAQKPIVTMSMSSIGLTSRLVGEQFGSAITFASVGKASAPGQIDYQELNQMLDIIHKNIQEA